MRRGQEKGKTIYRRAAPIAEAPAVSPSLQGVEWTVFEMNGNALAAEKLPTLKLEHGQASAFGGVNRMSGTYKLDGTSLSFGPMTATRIAGSPIHMASASLGLTRLRKRGKALKCTR